MSEKREKPHWEGKHYSFFQNTECEYFPCHQGMDPARFNCLFCYCPLYMLGPRCGGNFRYTEKGMKDCTGCIIPHLPENYGRITGKYKEIAEMMRQTDGSCLEKQTDGSHLVKQTGGSCPEMQKADEIRRKGKDFGRIVMMSCTERGIETMRRAGEALAELLPEADILQTGRCAYVPGFEKGPGLSQVTAKWFHKADALIYFAATGIAVRCIAPFARDKFKDPAVLVMDENGKFAISLLSGHAGGANRLCAMLAGAVGAEPVITTATDGRGLFAVDVFAAENGLALSDRTAAKQISARILAGEKLKLFLDGTSSVSGQNVSGRGGERGFLKIPSPEKYGRGICLTYDREEADVLVSCRRQPRDRENALYLIPRAVALGIGCRKGIAPEAVKKAALQILHDSGVFPQALCGIASIDLKKEEAGLHAFAQEWKLPLVFYTADELSRVPGTFSSSDFVRKITGVDCVCERSAVRLALELFAMPEITGRKEDAGMPACDAAGEDTGKQRENRVFLLQKKQSLEGVTASLAAGEIRFL